jgi:glutathione-independent formaldehyde dehydrogenase
VFMPEDPRSRDALAKKGQLAFDFGEFWTRGQRMGTGQTSVKNYNRYLCRLIEQGRAKPSFIVSHELPLDEAPEAYKHFDSREQGWTKVVLKPQLAAGTGKRSESKRSASRPAQSGSRARPH